MAEVKEQEQRQPAAGLLGEMQRGPEDHAGQDVRRRPEQGGSDVGRVELCGWHAGEAGQQGSKADCLAFVEANWTDMRPLSLRQKMAEGQ